MKIRKTYIYEPSAPAYMVSKIKEIEILRLKFRYIEVRYREDQARDEHGRFIDEGGSSASSSDNGGNDLTDHSESVRLDSNGVPFNYPNIELPYKEYKSFTDNVGMVYHSKYEGKEYCRYSTTRKTYYFENRGIGDYNIYRVKEQKDD